ncbi:cinnamoyl-CoA reductase 1-like [Rhododendron vialii]|uniref:cinnamoyl-CoA reductase 1-like n=1 Tax=Rhododendron vialii TaxID=182163 RepID=UPI00265FCD91|nr:cinnamoyl-CoA reductase 1-like [Rhododendron vialii]
MVEKAIEQLRSNNFPKFEREREREEWMGDKGKVCVTGAGGYVASWLVKLLLSKGYTVHGTLRDPQNEKNAHLMKLEKASENLKLFKVDLLDYNSLSAAIAGCNGVFHVASPVPSSSVPDPEIQLIEPAVKGTINVLEACSEANVKRVVVVSSGKAVSENPDWPKGRVMDETCWSDKEHCRRTKYWYALSKTEAESAALEFAKTSGLDVVRVCPTFVFGPMLQSTTNASSLVLIKLLKEGYEEQENRLLKIIDVRDVAEALLLAYEKPEADGRYICTAHMIKLQDLVEILKRIYPNYNYPKKVTEGKEEENISSEKLQKLGWSYRPLEETLVDSVEGYKQAGLLDQNELGIPL